MVIWDLLVFLCPFECEDVLCLKGLDESTKKDGSTNQVWKEAGMEWKSPKLETRPIWSE